MVRWLVCLSGLLVPFAIVDSLRAVRRKGTKKNLIIARRIAKKNDVKYM